MTVEQVSAVILQDEQAVKSIQKNGLEDKFAMLESMAMLGLEHLIKYADNEGVRLKAIDLVVRQRHGLLKPRERVTVTNNLSFLVERAERAKAIRDKTVNVTATVVTSSEKQVPSLPNETRQPRQLELVNDRPIEHFDGAITTESGQYEDCAEPAVAELICA
jgi:hypothetical protein